MLAVLFPSMLRPSSLNLMKAKTMSKTRSNPRLNARGYEVFSTTDPETGEVRPPRPRAVDIGFETKQRSLHELLAATNRSFPSHDDGDDDDDDFEVSDINYNPLQTELSPHSEGFVSGMGGSLSHLQKLAKKHGYRLLDPSTETSEPVGKTKSPKSAPIKQAPEASPEPSGSDAD